MVRFSCMELMWRLKSNDAVLFSDWLKTVQEIGFDGIGIFDSSLKQYLESPTELLQALSRYSLELASVRARTDLLDFSYYRKLIQCMDTLNCRLLVVGGGKGHEPEDIKAFAAVLNRIGYMSRSRDIVTMYHHHAGTMGDTLEHTEALLSQTDPEVVSAFCDVGHATQDFVEEDIESRALTFMKRYGPRLRLIEFKDWSPELELGTTIGNGKVEFPTLITWLKDQPYDGWISLEQNRPEPNTKPEACARKGLETVRRLWIGGTRE